MLNKYIKISIVIIILGILAYAGLGIYDYVKWVKIKKAVAAGGFTYQCGASKIIKVQPNCNYTPAGACTCALCTALCTNSTEVDIMPQEVCSIGSMNPAVVCVSPDVIAANSLTMGTPLEASAGKQAIFAGISNMMSGNGVIATPSMAASNIERIVNWFGFLIASFKNK